MKKFFALAVVAITVSGCASASDPGAMAVGVTQSTLIADNSPLHHAVTAPTVTGGKDTNPLWVSNVSNTDFAEALRQTLAADTILATDKGRFNLAAQLVSLKQPMVGLDMTVTADVKYTLTDAATGKVVWQKELTTPYTAKFGDAFLGVERLKLANEGAIKTNIEQMIAALIADSKTSPDLAMVGDTARDCLLG